MAAEKSSGGAFFRCDPHFAAAAKKRFQDARFLFLRSLAFALLSSFRLFSAEILSFSCALFGALSRTAFAVRGRAAAGSRGRMPREKAQNVAPSSRALRDTPAAAFLRSEAAQKRGCCKIDDSKKHTQKEDAFRGQSPLKSVYSLILS